MCTECSIRKKEEENDFVVFQFYDASLILLRMVGGKIENAVAWLGLVLIVPVWPCGL